MSLTKVSYSMIQGAVVNVLDFGAIGDGTTDDTAAIQAAVDSVTNGTVYFPNGTYKITNTITIDGSTKLSLNFVGNGLASEVVYAGTTANIPMFYYYNGDNSTFITVENLKFNNDYRSGDTTLNGVIAWRFGKKDAAATTGAGGTCNVTFRKNQITYCDTGLEIWSESDQFTVEECYFFVWTLYGVLNTTNPLVVSGTANSSFRATNNHFIGGQNGSWAIKAKGSDVAINNNTIQNATTGNGVWIYNSSGFTVENNYTESTGATKFVYVNNSLTGYIGENNIGGYPGATVFDIDATSKDVNFGSNFYSTAGGYPAYLINIASGATGVNIYGNQYQTVVGGGGIAGDVSFSVTDGSVTALNSLEAPLITSKKSIENVAGSSSYTMFTASANSCYLVNVSQEQEDYAATAIVTTTGNSSTAIVTSLYSTNPNLSITATGLDIKVNNGVGSTRTIYYGFIAIS